MMRLLRHVVGIGSILAFAVGSSSFAQADVAGSRAYRFGLVGCIVLTAVGFVGVIQYLKWSRS